MKDNTDSQKDDIGQKKVLENKYRKLYMLCKQKGLVF
jgi:hypothetical protein